MVDSAAIMFAWKSLQLKSAQMKTWMREPLINIPVCYGKMDVAVRRENHTIILSMPTKCLKFQEQSAGY